MNILDKIKIAIGYNRVSHKFDSSKIQEGDIKMLSKNQMVKNEKGAIVVCKRKNEDSPWKFKRLPFKGE
jgi:hypothetical protein